MRGIVIKGRVYLACFGMVRDILHDAACGCQKLSNAKKEHLSQSAASRAPAKV